MTNVLGQLQAPLGLLNETMCRVMHVFMMHKADGPKPLVMPRRLVYIGSLQRQSHIYRQVLSLHKWSKTAQFDVLL